MYSKNGTGSIAQIRLNIVVMQNNSDSFCEPLNNTLMYSFQIQ